MTRAVLDTNVVVSALLSPFGNEAQVLGAVLSGHIVPCMTREILAEYAEVLARPKFGFSRAETESLTEALRAKGAIVRPGKIGATSPDPGDVPFIVCAIAANATYLVTGNKRHFPEPFYGKARVVSAREMMNALHEQPE
jgi:putative PIN family toxin of toxin-antitoxin system